MKSIPVDRVVATFRYDPKSGFVFRKSTGKRVGFGCRRGYRRISFMNKDIYEHRLIWALQTGEWPEKDVDHKNCIRFDNRWENLREADNSQNHANSRRTTIRKRRHRWISKITVKGKEIWLGTFDTEEQARNAYATSAKEHFGEFARW